jgi:hypothetical protein
MPNLTTRMHLREARTKKQIDRFIAEKETTHPKASHHHFHATLKEMAEGNSKATKAASKQAPRAD